MASSAIPILFAPKLTIVQFADILQKQHSYTVSEKRAAVHRIEELSGQLSRGGDDQGNGAVAVVVKELGFPHRTVHGWWPQREKLMRFSGLSKSKTLKGQGRREKFTSAQVLVTYM